MIEGLAWCGELMGHRSWLPVSFSVQCWFLADVLIVCASYPSSFLFSQSVPAKESARQVEKCLMDVRSLFISHPQATELVQPGKVRSTTQRYRPSPLPCSVLRLASQGTMWRVRRPCRIASAS
jgi:hypothetical protein